MFSFAKSALKDLTNYLTNNSSFIDKINEEELLKELGSRQTQNLRKGMQKLICLIQSNNSTEKYRNLVFKIMDTRDSVTKVYINYYFLMLCTQIPQINKECIINMYTNTLLKDLNDKNERLKNCALDFLIKINDLEVFKGFIRKIRKLLQKGTIENKLRILILISKAIIQDYNFIEKNDLISDILLSIRDLSLQMNIYGYKCIIRNKNLIKYIQCNDLIRFAYKIANTTNPTLTILALETFYEVIINTKELLDEENISKIITICFVLINRNVNIAIITSKIILNLRENYIKEIFIALRRYLFVNEIDLFMLLQYIYTLINDFSLDYSNSEFIILESDPEYIKKIKLLILTLKPDQISKEEIKFLINNNLYLTDKKFNFTDKNCYLTDNNLCLTECIKFAVENNLPELIEDLLLKKELIFNSKIQQIFCIYKPNFLKWKNIIEKIDKQKTNESIYLLGQYSNKIVPTNSDWSGIIYNLNCYRRNVISKKDLYSQFKSFSKLDFISQLKCQIIRKFVESEDFNMINELVDTTQWYIKEKTVNPIFETANPTRIRTTGLDDPTIDQELDPQINGNLQNLNPFNVKSVDLNVKSVDLNVKSVELDDSQFVINDQNKQFYIENEEICIKSDEEICIKSDKEICIKSDDIKTLEENMNQKLKINSKELLLKNITNLYFTGSVYLIGSNLVIRVESITNPFTISYTYKDISTKPTLVTEQKDILIHKITFIHSFTIKVNETYAYSINMKYKQLINSVILPIKTLNRVFDKIEDYEIVNLDFFSEFYIESNCIGFSILDSLFVGKVFNKEVILKCENSKMIKELCEEILRRK